MQVFALSREIPWPVPLADILEFGAGRFVPFVDRRLAHRVVQLADALSRAHAEGDRRVGRAEGRRPDSRDIHAERRGQHGHAVDVAELALVGPETERGIALDVLDVAIAFADGKPDVGHAGVVLEIQELLGTTVRVAGRGYAP